jgi:hypothetical protein
MTNNAIPITDHDAARTARNRENASHSTGPKTEAGKKRSCLNALRHGLTGHTMVLPAEDHVAYQDLTNQFFDDFKPVGILEKHLVQALADTSWRLHRVSALESTLLGLCSSEHQDNIVAEHPEAHAALVVSEGRRERNRSLAVYSVHGARLSRQFEKTLDKLENVQEKRRAIEASQLSDAAALFQVHKNEDVPYQPSEDGFVFSNTEIQAFILRRDRLQAATAAAQGRAWFHNLPTPNTPVPQPDTPRPHAA